MDTKLENYLDRKSALEKFTKFLNDGENFAYLKFGDGELACMNMENGHNCDRHPYSEKLGKKLIDSFINLNKNYKNIYIANWEDDSYAYIRDKLCKEHDLNLKSVFYDTMLHTEGQIDEYIYKFMATLRYNRRRKIFFGPQRLNGVERFLKINTHVEVPLINAFQYYENYVDWLNDNLKENDIYIFSSGMMSKVLIHDIKKINKNTTCIDMGSSFDPIFVGQTRLKQIKTRHLREFYRDLLL